jgi:hypothetical protein
MTKVLLFFLTFDNTDNSLALKELSTEYPGKEDHERMAIFNDWPTLSQHEPIDGPVHPLQHTYRA